MVNDVYCPQISWFGVACTILPLPKIHASAFLSFFHVHDIRAINAPLTERIFLLFCRDNVLTQQVGSKTNGDSGRVTETSHAGPAAVATAQSDVLQLHHELCCGSEGIVAAATYSGRPAIVKLLGPDRGGLKAWRREVDMYQRLVALQGRLVPQLLGSGHLEAGVHYIALSCVEGTTFSSLPAIPQRAMESASAGLQLLQETVPGFLHGDLRPANIMWASPSEEGAASAAASCVFIDFGRSRCDGDSAQQAEEELMLRRMLRVP